MSNPVYATFTLPATAANNIAQSQTPGAAGALTLNGSTVTAGVALAPTSIARRVNITSAGNDSVNTFTVTGTDRGGVTQSEIITGPNTTTVTGVLDFKTVTSIVISAAAVGAITSGFSATGSTKWYPMDHFRASGFTLSIGMHLLSGTSTASIEYTLEPYDKTIFELDPANAVGSFLVPLAIVPAAFSGKSANTDGSLTTPVRAVRLTVTAGTGSWLLSLIQQGLQA